jgi:hypothetical protein
MEKSVLYCVKHNSLSSDTEGCVVAWEWGDVRECRIVAATLTWDQADVPPEPPKYDGPPVMQMAPTIRLTRT